MLLQPPRGATDASPRSSCGFLVLGPQSGRGGSSEWGLSRQNEKTWSLTNFKNLGRNMGKEEMAGLEFILS